MGAPTSLTVLRTTRWNCSGDVDYVTVSTGQGTALRNRPQKRPQIGVPIRRLDHLNLMVANAGAVRDFMVDILGFRERERVIDDDNGSVLGKSSPSVTQPFARRRNGAGANANARAAPPCLLPLHIRPASLRFGGTGQGSWHRDRNRTRPAWDRRSNVSLHAGAGGQSRRAHGRSWLHDLRSGVEDGDLEGIRGPQCRSCPAPRSPAPESFWSYGTPAEEEQRAPASPEAVAALIEGLEEGLIPGEGCRLIRRNARVVGALGLSAQPNHRRLVQQVLRAKKENCGVSKEAVEIHVLLTRSLFGGGILRRLLPRA